MPLPQVIFFDAVGTLFGVRGSVGAVYADLSRRFGVNVEPTSVDRAFFKSFKAATPMAFPGTDPTEIADREYAWWWAIAAETFQEVGVLNQFADFSAFFSALYDHFAAADPWFIYADTLSTLDQWRDRGVELGVLSNFDSRIHSVLEALNLSDYFSSVTISTEAGVSKPSPEIFQLALQKHSCPPEVAWHVGDSFREDYEGAVRAGLRGIWLKRE